MTRKYGPSGTSWRKIQRKTSAKSPEAPAANADSSSPSDSKHSECTAIIAEMLTDLELKMEPSHPASILLRTQLEEAKKERDGAQPLLEKTRAAE